MFRYLSLMLAMLLAMPAAAVVARTYPDALAKAGDKNPLVIFCYVANGDKVSAKKYDEFIKHHKIDPAVRKAVFLVLPVYQYPNDQQKKEMERTMGGKKLPGGVWSYPSLAVVDGRNNLRGIVQKASEMKDAETAGIALTKLLEDFREQEALLDKAEKASGARKSELLMAAADININLPNHAVEDTNKGGRRGMKDTAGVADRMKFDPFAVVEKLQPMSFSAANAYIRGLMAKDGLSRSQRQEIMAAYAGHLRRNDASTELLRAAYTEMRNIDPDSMYGAYAEGAIALWVDKDSAANQVSVPVEITRNTTTISDNEVNMGSTATDEKPASTIAANDGNMTAMGSRTNPFETGDNDTPNDSEPDDESDFTGGGDSGE